MVVQKVELLKGENFLSDWVYLLSGLVGIGGETAFTESLGWLFAVLWVQAVRVCLF